MTHRYRIYPGVPETTYFALVAWAAREGIKPTALASKVLCDAVQAEEERRSAYLSSTPQSVMTAEKIRLHIQRDRDDRERRVEGKV